MQSCYYKQWKNQLNLAITQFDKADIAKHENMLRLRENLVVAEEDRLSGRMGYSVDEVSAMMKNAVQDVLDEKTASSSP